MNTCYPRYPTCRKCGEAAASDKHGHSTPSVEGPAVPRKRRASTNETPEGRRGLQGRGEEAITDRCFDSFGLGPFGGQIYSRARRGWMSTKRVREGDVDAAHCMCVRSDDHHGERDSGSGSATRTRKISKPAANTTASTKRGAGKGHMARDLSKNATVSRSTTLEKRANGDDRDRHVSADEFGSIPPDSQGRPDLPR